MPLALNNVMNNAICFFKKNEKLIIIITIGLVVLRFAWLNYINWQSGEISNGMPGIKFWLDTDRYIGGAEKIINGAAFEYRENQFIGYMSVIAVTKILNLPLGSVIIIQLITALLAALALFDSTKMLCGSKWAGIVAAALYLSNPFIVQWHQYILTESLYSSFVIFSFWSLARLVKNKKPLNYILSVLILICTIFLRPNGWILLPVFALFYFIISDLSRRIKFIMAAVAILVFLLGASSIRVFKSSIQITTPLENLQKGVTVWEHHELYLNMPQEPELKNDNLADGVKYILRHPFASIKLGVVRAGYTLIHIRPYHSFEYKLRVLFWVIPAYLLAIGGFLFFKKEKISLAALLIIAGHLLVVALSYAEHDSRFDIYILPIFYSLAGAGFVGITKWGIKKFK